MMEFIWKASVLGKRAANNPQLVVSDCICAGGS